MWLIWREIGHQMHIQDIPETYEEMRAWADSYEKRVMIPNEMNHQLGETTIAILIYYTPSFIKPFAKKLIIGLMDDNLRNAMMYPVQPTYIYRFINGFFMIRRFLSRNFFLPRWKPVKYVQDKPNKWGRYNVNWAASEVIPIEMLMTALVFER
jgi:hypothetical protein